jgi:hypothetical protein
MLPERREGMKKRRWSLFMSIIRRLRDREKIRMQMIHEGWERLMAARQETDKERGRAMQLEQQLEMWQYQARINRGFHQKIFMELVELRKEKAAWESLPLVLRHIIDLATEIVAQKANPLYQVKIINPQQEKEIDG